MGQIIDTMIVYQILRKLVTPFIQMPAYHMGIIDEKGDFLKKVSTLTTAEKETVTTLDVLVINLKRILGKLPGGASRLASLAAALYLIRAHGKVNESNIVNTLFTLEEDFKRYLAEDAPANATGPAVA
jgi:predicted NBD/HSP70 family sugar kinase